jgi:hypothetical protein
MKIFPIKKVFEYSILLYKVLDMFEFLSSFKSDVKKALAGIHERFLNLETKVEALMGKAKETATTVVDAPKTATTAFVEVPKEAIDTVVAEVKKDL